jgi:hypothetical protein
MIEGIVVHVIVNRQDPAKKAVTEVVADYDLGGRAIKRAIINIQSLKAKEVENAVVEEPGAEVQGDGFPVAPPALPIPATAVEVPAPPTVEEWKLLDHQFLPHQQQKWKLLDRQQK